MKKKIIIISAIIAAAVVARFVFSLYGQIMMGKMMAKTATPSVVLGEIQTADVLKQVEAPGRILSKYRIDVLARIDGYLTKSYFKEGDHVKKGQVLFEIEPEEWYLAVKKARANVANTKAQLIYAEKQLKRGEELVKQDYIAKAAYDNLLSQRDALSAQLTLNQATLSDALRNYGYTKVKAPVDGQVGMITVTVGNYVNPSAGALTTIYSNNPIYVTFPIDSKEYDILTKIDAENVVRKVDLFFPTGEKYEIQGNQDFHDNKVDETTGTVTMRATFENPKSRLLNGDFVKVIVFSKNTINVPIVPQTAVLENPQGKYVYAVDEKNIPHIVQIKISGQYKDNWIVTEGLKKSDIIVVDGIQKVIPDRPVKIVDKETMEKIKKHQKPEEGKK
ncbi:MAG TPA: efflux RND transporter periplasmic adaptor subunit [Candidatus Gastranaerophilaceae bacterium]|nr:efflux RND transporter periplasmic adaptor subunit [Candidatus Gastranaerophilaceae bacterium]HPT41178.1 efflux RND transporter periplasmic adaptor subunit [Candidatus Gastranaerophilaceae bacterium]